MNISLFNNPHCFTRSALERNFTAMASSRNPKTTFTVLSQPPDFGNDCNQPGNIANKAKGKAKARPNPASPTVNGHAPSVNVPANKEPRMGPVHEKETIANVNAMKKIPPRSLIPDLVLILFANPEGRVISKYPKNEIAKTTKMPKNKIFNQTLVEILFNTSGFV